MMILTKLWASLKFSSLFWLVVYLFIYIVGVHLAWLGRSLQHRHLQAIIRSRIGGWLVQGTRLLYRLILPYVALLQGVTTPQDMGLVNRDWFSDLSWSIALTSGGLVLLAWGWRSFVQAADDYPFPQNLGVIGLPWGWSYALWEVACWQMSWAFQRAAWMPVLGTYYGTFSGLGTSLVAAALNPAVRAALAIPGQREQVLHTASLALVTTLVYLTTSNLWMCATAHWVLQIMLAKLILHGRETPGQSAAKEEGYPLAKT